MKWIVKRCIKRKQLTFQSWITNRPTNQLINQGTANKNQDHFCVQFFISFQNMYRYIMFKQLSKWRFYHFPVRLTSTSAWCEVVLSSTYNKDKRYHHHSLSDQLWLIIDIVYHYQDLKWKNRFKGNVFSATLQHKSIYYGSLNHGEA